MTRGFRDVAEFEPVIGWTLYQVAIDKYHVMFWFENGHALLNIAHSFSIRPGDGGRGYTYTVSNDRNDSDGQKLLDVNRILRQSVRKIHLMNARDLGLAFGNGDTLVVHDNPNTISWWFYHYQASETIPENLPLKWFVSDVESEADL